MDQDLKIRLAAFEWLNKLGLEPGDSLSRTILEKGYIFEDELIHVIGPQGIFTPKAMKDPLSITTSPNSPYDDKEDGRGFLLYRYRGNNPEHRDNVGLRNTMKWRLPLIYFKGVRPGIYAVQWPVFVEYDNPTLLTFSISFDSLAAIDRVADSGARYGEADIGRRAYITREVTQRLHQKVFSEQVLYAYDFQCSLCRLRHRELLDAAHILPDKHPKGDPVVPNGLALCKLHHAAYDKNFIGIAPDYEIHVRKDILEEEITYNIFRTFLEPFCREG
jgi:putative restriction endonuclease